MNPTTTFFILWTMLSSSTISSNGHTLNTSTSPHRPSPPLTTSNGTKHAFRGSQLVTTEKAPLPTPEPVPGFSVLQADAGPSFRKQRIIRRQDPAAQDSSDPEELVPEPDEKSYEGDLIASGQDPAINAGEAEKSVAGRWYMILVYVLAGIIVLGLGFCVVKALCYRSRYRGMWW